jgi:hypothetical protein
VFICEIRVQFPKNLTFSKNARVQDQLKFCQSLLEHGLEPGTQVRPGRRGTPDDGARCLTLAANAVSLAGIAVDAIAGGQLDRVVLDPHG